MRWPHGIAAGITLLLVVSGSARADIFFMKDGRRIEGVVVRERNASLRVETRDGLVVLARDAIDRHRHIRTPFDAYVRKRKRTAAHDVAGQLRLARWCLRKGLERQAREHYVRVHALDPYELEALAVLTAVTDHDPPATDVARRPATPPAPNERRSTPPTDAAKPAHRRDRGPAPTVRLVLRPALDDRNHVGYLTQELRNFLARLDAPLRLVSTSSAASDYVLEVDLETKALKTTRFYGRIVIGTRYQGRARVRLHASGDRGHALVDLPAITHEMNLGTDVDTPKAFDIAREQTLKKVIERLGHHPFLDGGTRRDSGSKKAAGRRSP